MGDMNKVTLIGTAITTPTFLSLSSKTPMVVFTLRLKETWKRDNKTQSRNNLVNIELAGKNSFKAKEIVKVGKRYHIEGMLRSDSINGIEKVRIRCMFIEEEDDEQFLEGLQEGLSRAYAVSDNSDDLGAVKAKLQILLGDK